MAWWRQRSGLGNTFTNVTVALCCTLPYYVSYVSVVYTYSNKQVNELLFFINEAVVFVLLALGLP